MCQHEETNEIQKQLNEDFSNVCDWFVEKKLSMYFIEDEIKSIHFDSKFKRKIIKKQIMVIYKLNNILKSNI